MVTFLIRLFFDSGITMNTGMTRAYRKNVIEAIDNIREWKGIPFRSFIEVTEPGVLGLQK